MNVIYRGWMMTADTYQLFCLALMEKRMHLINEAKEYENCHYFPNSYRAFGTDTARVLLFPLHQRIDVEEVGKHFTRFMVKDYVKSVKGSIFRSILIRQFVNLNLITGWMNSINLGGI